MRLFVVLLQILMVAFAANGQQFEGRLNYEQKMNGVTSGVLVQLEANRIHITRNEAQVLHYVFQANGQLMSWVKGEAKPTNTEVALPAVLKTTLTGRKRIIAGMEALEFGFTLKDGSEFTGWYTTALKVAHNQLVTPIQGEYWGFLPTDGALMEWQVKSPKKTVVIEGRLMDFQAGTLPASAFVFQ